MRKLNRFISWMVIIQILIKVSGASTTQAAKNLTQCGDLQCSNNAKCKDDGHGGHVCRCHTGFAGKTCLDDFDECGLGDPCMHRGRCHNSIGSYRCECLEGWSGPDRHCDIKDNSTTVHKCMPGWIGDMCQDQCLNNSMCRPTEVCKKRGRGLRCLCAAGWHGVNCTIDIDECTKTPCPNTATCMNTQGSYECPCLSGWKGDRCNEDIDECLINPCQHSSTCTNKQGYYNCTCALGWKGDKCDEDIDECLINPCQHSSTCTNEQGYYNCTCALGWKGEKCDEDIDECLINPCQHSSTCTNEQGYYNCTCALGWKGDNCTNDIDECTSNPCTNEKTCYNIPGSFECKCSQGWDGVNCTNDIDECKTFQCRNSGTCINTNGSYKCKCGSGWQGDDCGEDINECDQNPCNATVFCINNQGSFSCTSTQMSSKGRSDTSQTKIILFAVLGSLLMVCSIAIFLGIMKYKWNASHDVTKVSPDDTEHFAIKGKEASQQSQQQQQQDTKSKIRSESQTIGRKKSVRAENRFIQPEWNF